MEITARLEISFTPEATALLDKFISAAVVLATTSGGGDIKSALKSSSSIDLLNEIRSRTEMAPVAASLDFGATATDKAAADQIEIPLQTAPEETTQADAPKRRRGRPPAAAKLAEQQAAAMERQSEPTAQVETAERAQPQAAVPPGIAMPMGAVPPGVVHPAMPAAVAAPAVNGVPSLDDLRECMLQANQKSPKVAFRIMNSRTWPDGSVKPTWYTADSVPPDMRERLIEEITQALM